ncbi:unnamed protein product [Soboliphyme baturini]|uniref:Transmembrane protein n=1 Tax=Soboliphyme baturini TaxID=241478 RepID=A0A183J2E5_9BILA|nr:unnamed protein product [Soboliphyme baturini]
MTTDIVIRSSDYVDEHGVEEYDENSSARLFERSRIKALAGECAQQKVDEFVVVHKNTVVRIVINILMIDVVIVVISCYVIHYSGLQLVFLACDFIVDSVRFRSLSSFLLFRFR